MSATTKAAKGVWGFVVGDDWRLAVGASATIGAAALLVGLDVNAWWFPPLAVLLVLWLSVRTAARGGV